MIWEVKNPKILETPIYAIGFAYWQLGIPSFIAMEIANWMEWYIYLHENHTNQPFMAVNTLNTWMVWVNQTISDYSLLERQVL